MGLNYPPVNPEADCAPTHDAIIEQLYNGAISKKITSLDVFHRQGTTHDLFAIVEKMDPKGVDFYYQQSPTMFDVSSGIEKLLLQGELPRKDSKELMDAAIGYHIEEGYRRSKLRTLVNVAEFGHAACAGLIGVPLYFMGIISLEALQAFGALGIFGGYSIGMISPRVRKALNRRDYTRILQGADTRNIANYLELYRLDGSIQANEIAIEPVDVILQLEDLAKKP